MLCCYVFGMISSSRMKFCMMCNLLLRFNKLQPTGCNRVSPACSVLLYTICIVLSVMIFLCNDHNKWLHARCGWINHHRSTTFWVAQRAKQIRTSDDQRPTRHTSKLARELPLLPSVYKHSRARYATMIWAETNSCAKFLFMSPWQELQYSNTITNPRPVQL